MRKSGAVLVLIACLTVGSQAIAQGTESSHHPPQNLKLVGDHWTPWDPPPAGPGAYIIQKDDTLWDLAGEWLGDPFLWPQIWDENRYILDSHWIYPGDPLVVPGKPTVVPDGGPPPTEEAATPPVEEFGELVETRKPTAPATPQAAPMVPAAVPNDLYCSGYIDPEHQYSDLWITGAEIPEITIYGQGHVVYLSQGANHGIKAGSEFAIVRAGREVMHPGTKKKVLGRFIRRMGKLRVMITQENTSTAVIVTACEDINPSDELVPWKQIPIPMLDSMPDFDRFDVSETGGPTGSVVYVADDRMSVAKGNVIQVDLGVGSGVEPGDVLMLYRTRKDLPRTILGQAVVLTVEPLTSTAKITTSVSETSVGDGVEVYR